MDANEPLPGEDNIFCSVAELATHDELVKHLSLAIDLREEVSAHRLQSSAILDREPDSTSLPSEAVN